MRSKKEASVIWDEICNNCRRHSKEFAGIPYVVREGTISYIRKLDNLADMFSLAILSKDQEAIAELYNSIDLSEHQKELLEDLKSKNREVLLTVNPILLEEKYSFLTPILEELSLDRIIQDKLVSLDDFELDLLEKITNYSIDYGVKPNKLLNTIINNIGYCSIGPRNNDALLEKYRSFLNMVKEIVEFNQNSKRISRTVGGKFYTIKNIIILN